MNVRKKRGWLGGLGALGLCGWCALAAGRAEAAPPAPSAAATAKRVSEASDRKSVSITVYNSNFGLVREVRQLTGLPSGRVALEFRDVASTIQPETVAIKALGDFKFTPAAAKGRPSQVRIAIRARATSPQQLASNSSASPVNALTPVS